MPNAKPEIVVTELYKRLLDRNPVDAAGYQHNLSLLIQGQANVRGLVRGFLSSAEYVSRFVAGRPPQDSVNMLYMRTLGRPADPGGLATHVNVLNAYGWAVVVNSLVDSVEYMNRWHDYTVPCSEIEFAYSIQYLYIDTAPTWRVDYPYQPRYLITAPPGYRMIRHTVTESTRQGNGRWAIENDTPNSFVVMLWIDKVAFGGLQSVGVRVVLELERV